MFNHCFYIVGNNSENMTWVRGLSKLLLLIFTKSLTRFLDQE